MVNHNEVIGLRELMNVKESTLMNIEHDNENIMTTVTLPQNCSNTIILIVLTISCLSQQGFFN